MVGQWLLYTLIGMSDSDGGGDDDDGQASIREGGTSLHALSRHAPRHPQPQHRDVFTNPEALQISLSSICIFQSPASLFSPPQRTAD